MKYILMANGKRKNRLYRYDLETGAVSTIEQKVDSGCTHFKVCKEEDTLDFYELNFAEVSRFRSLYGDEWFQKIVRDSNYNLMMHEEKRCMSV